MDFNELAIFKLGGGAHNSVEEGLCAMEAVAWLEGLPHSDRPECTCPVIAAYVRVINDRFPNQRQKLIPYLPRLVNTVSKKHEQERMEYLVWQAIKVFAPLALEAAGLNQEASKLREFEGSFDAAAYAARAVADAAYADAAYAARAAAARAEAAAYAAARAARAEAAAYADAAYAARAAAAYAAARAAYAAEAAYAAYADAYAAEAAFKALDGVLKIGPEGKFSMLDNIPLKIAEYKELVS